MITEMTKPYDFKKYFDFDEQTQTQGFQNLSGQFNPEDGNYFAQEISKGMDGEVIVDFFFEGALGQWSDGAHYRVAIRFAGYLICDDVISFSKEESHSDKIVFQIKKGLLGSTKTITIENNQVGKVVIKCKKLYGQGLDPYSQNQSGKWIPYRG